MKFGVPATSANLGIGFDCMGLALDIYNYFEVDKSDKWNLSGFDESVSVEDNLFVIAYNSALDYKGIEKDCLSVKLDAYVPMSRGLGSSATMIVGGIYAASILHDNCLSKKEMLDLASEMEGHPDNVAPAIYGGLCIVKDGHMLQIDVDERWKFGVWIIDEKVSTHEARKVVPLTYERKDMVCNVASALLAIDALKNFNKENIGLIMEDKIHEPYRKKLIPGFEERKQYALSKGASAFIISGSGSTCLSISEHNLVVDLKDVVYKEVKVNTGGIKNA